MNNILVEAGELFEYTQAIRRDLHQHPELGFEEVRTAKIVSDELRKMGLEIINAPNLKDAEQIIDKLVHKIQAVLFSANIPSKELSLKGNEVASP